MLDAMWDVLLDVLNERRIALLVPISILSYEDSRYLLTCFQSHARGDSHVTVFSHPVGMGHMGSVMADRGVLVQPHRGQAAASLRTRLSHRYSCRYVASVCCSTPGR